MFSFSGKMVMATLTEITGKPVDTVFEFGRRSSETFGVSAEAALKATADAMQLCRRFGTTYVGFAQRSGLEPVRPEMSQEVGEWAYLVFARQFLI